LLAVMFHPSLETRQSVRICSCTMHCPAFVSRSSACWCLHWNLNPQAWRPGLQRW